MAVGRMLRMFDCGGFMGYKHEKQQPCYQSEPQCYSHAGFTRHAACLAGVDDAPAVQSK